MRPIFFLPLCLCLADAAPLKVDLNQPSRPNAADPGFVRWDIAGGNSFSGTFDGVTVTFTRVGENGTGLASTWYKTFAESAELNAKMISDGLTVAGTTSGATLEMRIAGLAAGTHTLLTYHNTCDNPTTGPFSPIHISLGGERVVTSLQPSNRVDDNNSAPVAYLEFEATAGEDVVVLFEADTSDPSDLVQNVVLNGFEIDTPNSSRQARQPVPADGDLHVDADDGTFTLEWSEAAAGTTVSHDFYFGTNRDAVLSASHASSEFSGNQTETARIATELNSRQTYYWRVDEIDGLGNTTQGEVWSFRPRQLAFPGAGGYGRFAIGGRGGKVVVVDSLDDDPADPQPGTLRHAIEVETGPRTIVFNIGGLITLGDRLVVNDGRVTLAGQTAPGKGICIRGRTLGLSGGTDVIVRHLRSRPGDISGTTIDGMGMAGSDHCIIDHCSISWTIDEAFSSRSARNITLQHTLISEALNVAGHKNYPPGTAHGYAASISGNVGSFHRNLLAHCNGRNWSLAGGLDGDGFYAGRLDITNNVVYNWARRTTDGGAMEVNFVGNYYKPGPASSYFFALNAQYDGFPGMQRYYFAGNVMPGHFDESNQTAGRTLTATHAGNLPPYETFVAAPFFPSEVETQTAHAAYKRVLSDVGCTRPVIDDHDIRVIGETLAGTTTFSGSVSGLPGLPDSQNDVGGWEEYPTVSRPAGWDSDGDGLPDWWEILHSTDPHSAPGDLSDAHSYPDDGGYTALEHYLHWMAMLHTRCLTDGAVNLDLAPYSRGYAAATFTFSEEVGCSAAMVPGTTVARITPHAGFEGLAKLRVTVRDAEGDKMDFPIGIHVTADFPSPAHTLEIRRKNDALELRAAAAPDEEVRLEFSVDLHDWSPLSDFTGDGNARHFPMPDAATGEPKFFFRLRPLD